MAAKSEKAEEKAERKLCFVIGPIGDPGSEVRKHADWLLEGIIDPVFSGHFPDFIIERADKIAAPGSINSQVINRLFDAPLVIADMSKHNANAFYEMGIRHMMTQLPTIHMIHIADKIPFDVAPYRAIPFSYDSFADLSAAQVALKNATEEAIKPHFRVENPVTHARGVVRLEEHAKPEIKVVLDEMQSLRERLGELEGRDRNRGDSGGGTNIVGYSSGRLSRYPRYSHRIYHILFVSGLASAQKDEIWEKIKLLLQSIGIQYSFQTNETGLSLTVDTTTASPRTHATLGTRLGKIDGVANVEHFEPSDHYSGA